MAKEKDKDKAAAPKKGGGAMSTILALLVITGLGVGAGGLFGIQAAQKIGPNAVKTSASVHAAAPAHDAHGATDAHGAKDSHGNKDSHGGKDAGKDGKAAGPRLVNLPPIVTNIQQPEKVWIRMEASAVMEGDGIEKLSGQLVEDIIAYLKTCTLEQIQGASGYQYLREDLTERVRLRGQGKVRDFVLQSFIIE